jgi:hypothetical protein
MRWAKKQAELYGKCSGCGKNDPTPGMKTCQECRTAHRAWQIKNMDHVRTYQRHMRYGITEPEYLEHYAAQAGRCALCGDHKELVVDHDHETGRVRGLLCTPCNTALGRLGDNRERLERVLAYVSKAG